MLVEHRPPKFVFYLALSNAQLDVLLYDKRPLAELVDG